MCQRFISILPQSQVRIPFTGKENGWVVIIKMNTRQRMSDNQLSVWVADFPKEVLILLKFIRKLLKHLSGMLISSQKEARIASSEKVLYWAMVGTLFLITSISIKADVSWGLTVGPARSCVTGLALKQIPNACHRCPPGPLLLSTVPLTSGSD